MAQEAARVAQAQLLVQYEARLPPHSKKFQWPPPAHLLVAQTDLHNILFHTGEKSESDNEYDRSFLKHLVKNIEKAIDSCNEADASWMGVSKNDWAVDDILLERYISLISQPDTSGTICGTSAPPAVLTRRYFPVNHGPIEHSLLGSCDFIQSMEEGKAISHGTTGLKTWEASLRLAAYIVRCPEHCAAEKRVLELGSGTGLLGLVCARLVRAAGGQLSNIFLTDMEGQVLERLQESARISA